MRTRVLAAALALSMIATAQGATAPPATATAAAPADEAAVADDKAERARMLAWTRELEAAPLAKDAETKRSWLVDWLREVKGLKVVVCDAFGVLEQSNRKVGSLLLTQYMFGSASYLIEHPSANGRDAAVQLAGVTSALKAYAALRKADPLQRVGHFDQLLELQAKGGLSEYVRSRAFEKCSKS